MEEELVYWLWLHKMYGGTVTFKKLLDRYMDAGNIYRTLKNGRDFFGIAGNVDSEKLNSFTPDDAKRVIDECAQKGWYIIPYDSPDYPSLLRFIKDPPAVLFADGKKELLSSPYTFAVVGTRDCSDSARVSAFRTGLYLSACSVCVVSGGALGVDSCVHEGAVLAPGGTVAVLGRGLGAPPVMKTEYMSDRIRSNGVYVTEYFPDAGTRSFNFPRRNRIISGMCMGTAVVEAAEKSGALITAELAAKQSRRVFAISQDILKSGGCAALLNSGAIPFGCAGDILAYYMDDYPAWKCDDYMLNASVKSDGLEGKLYLVPGALTPEEYEGYCTEATASGKAGKAEKTKKSALKPAPAKEAVPETPAVRKELPEGMSDEAKAVYAVLEKTPVYMDDIQIKTGLGTQEIMCAVTELELEDLAVLHPGNRVSL